MLLWVKVNSGEFLTKQQLHICTKPHKHTSDVNFRRHTHNINPVIYGYKYIYSRYNYYTNRTLECKWSHSTYRTIPVLEFNFA